jgi:hypothetical protein
MQQDMSTNDGDAVSKLQQIPMTTEQQISSPATYVLADAIAATPPQRRVLTVLGIRRNGAGALPALRTATRAVAAAAVQHPSARASAWLEILRALVDLVTAASAKSPWLDILCPAIGHRMVCDVLADPARCALPLQARERLDAWLGLHIFHSLSRGGVVAVSTLDDWETLRRTGTPRANTSAPWIGAAKCMPLDAAEIDKLLLSVRNERLKDALQSTLAALAADIPDPEAISSLMDPPAPTSPSIDPASSLDCEEGDDADGEAEEGKGEDAEFDGVGDEAGSDSSLLTLLMHRGIHAGYRGQFGVTSIYGELQPPNLRRTCLSLAVALETGPQADRTRAAVAEVSLKLPLSPRRTLSVPLACNDDVWLDLPSRSLYWNFDRVLSSRECDPEGSDKLGHCKPVRIRLSDACALRLNELLGANPSASSLRELVGAGSDRNATTVWLTAYGDFLRSHGDDNYRAYSVRFARSYRSVYLERGHGAVAAALLGFDFATVPAGLLHYISLSSDSVTQWQVDVDRYLGIHWTPDARSGASS